MTKEKELKFEEALNRLEEIVRRLEEGNLPLDESLSLFEEGMKLSKICSKRLNEARGRIEILIRDENGGLTLKPFSPEEPSEEDNNR